MVPKKTRSISSTSSFAFSMALHAATLARSDVACAAAAIRLFLIPLLI
jgi:hypothetical protein